MGVLFISDILKLKEEIETLKSKLRIYLETDVDLDQILELNYRIDDLIVKFYRLKKIEKEQLKRVDRVEISKKMAWV